MTWRYGTHTGAMFAFLWRDPNPWEINEWSWQQSHHTSFSFWTRENVKAWNEQTTQEGHFRQMITNRIFPLRQQWQLLQCWLHFSRRGVVGRWQSEGRRGQNPEGGSFQRSQRRFQEGSGDNERIWSREHTQADWSCGCRWVASLDCLLILLVTSLPNLAFRLLQMYPWNSERLFSFSSGFENCQHRWVPLCSNMSNPKPTQFEVPYKLISYLHNVNLPA